MYATERSFKKTYNNFYLTDQPYYKARHCSYKTKQHPHKTEQHIYKKAEHRAYKAEHRFGESVRALSFGYSGEQTLCPERFYEAKAKGIMFARRCIQSLKHELIPQNDAERERRKAGTILVIISFIICLAFLVLLQPFAHIQNPLHDVNYSVDCIHVYEGESLNDICSFYTIDNTTLEQRILWTQQRNNLDNIDNLAESFIEIPVAQKGSI
ncbi:MAG: hypothetical protein IKE43_02030 [Coriobacteriales bacterium]|nr:hypothetical protein [Coriobacteriales bacterium]